ncbi:MAG: cell division protein FtsL [Clostridia bacterium]
MNAQKHTLQEEGQPIPRPETKGKLKVIAGKKNRNKAILWTLIVFLAFFIVISRYSALTRMNYDIATLTKRMNTQSAINSDLMVELDKKINLPQIRYVAQTQIGMKMPETSQIVYIEVPRTNKTEVSNPPKGFQEKLSDFFNAVKEGFHELKAILG